MHKFSKKSTIHPPQNFRRQKNDKTKDPQMLGVTVKNAVARTTLKTWIYATLIAINPQARRPRNQRYTPLTLNRPFALQKCSDLLWGCFYLRVRCPGRKAIHFYPVSRSRNCGAMVPHSPTCLQGIKRLIKHGNILTCR